MKQRLILGLSLILLVTVIILIAGDLFTRSSGNQENPNEYNLEKLRRIDTSLLCYSEVKQLKTSLTTLNGLAIDENLNVFIVGDDELQIYNKTWNKTAGFKVDSFAHCIAVGKNKKIYLGVDNHVEVYDPSGKKMNSWKSFTDDGYITSLALKDENLYVADAVNKVLLRYDKTGKLLNTIGRKDKIKEIDGFIIPSMYFDVAVGPDNDLWVANTGRHTLQNFSPEGELLSSWGIASMQIEGFAGCCNPVHFTILPDGRFVTYEKGLDRIKVYNQTGTFVCVVAGPSNIDENSLNTCTVSSPVHDLVCDKNGTIYVLDGVAKLIRIYAKSK